MMTGIEPQNRHFKMMIEIKQQNLNWVKSVQIRTLFLVRIQSKCREIRTRKKFHIWTHFAHGFFTNLIYILSNLFRLKYYYYHFSILYWISHSYYNKIRTNQCGQFQLVAATKSQLIILIKVLSAWQLILYSVLFFLKGLTFAKLEIMLSQSMLY